MDKINEPAQASVQYAFPASAPAPSITVPTAMRNLIVAATVVGLMAAVGAFLGFLIQSQPLGALIGAIVGIALLPRHDTQTGADKTRAAGQEAEHMGD